MTSALLGVLLIILTPVSVFSGPPVEPISLRCTPDRSAVDLTHRIAPGDALLLCFGEQGLLVLVQPDGTIPAKSFSSLFQYPPTVRAAGLTAMELREALLNTFKIPVTMVYATSTESGP